MIEAFLAEMFISSSSISLPSVVILLLSSMFDTGCSFIAYDRSLKASADESAWVKTPDTDSDAKVSIQIPDTSATLITHATYDVGGCPISGGPLIVPVIPLAFFCIGNEKSLRFTLLIESPDQEVTLDMDKVRLVRPDGGLIPALSAYYCEPDPESLPSFYCSLGRPSHDLPVRSSPRIVGKGNILWTTYYKYSGSFERLTMKIGGLYVGGLLVNVHPLVLRRRNEIRYCPIFLSGHESCFEF